MTTNRTIEKTIEINATPGKVWQVFTDPVITRQMGGEYATDWKAGSSFGWKNKNGIMLTQGVILQIKPALLLQHSLFDSANKSQVISVITYRFTEKSGTTILQSKEDLNYTMTDDQYNDASAGWDFALKAVKEIAEKL